MSVTASTPDTAHDLERTPLVVWLLLAATFVAILNETIMNVALRPLMVELDVSARAVQWLASAFMLTMAVVIPITGFLIQRFTTRALFGTAMSLFAAGTLLAATAPGFAVLLGARVVQACGTAIMMPLLMTTLMTVVPARRRGRVMGNVSIVISVAPALGPTISGLILDLLSWRWMFGIILPLAVIMLVAGLRKVTNVGIRTGTPVDVLSVVLAALGFGGLVYGLSRIGAETGEGAGGQAQLWIALGVGGLGVLTFVLRQLRLQRRDRALLDLRTFRFGIFTTATIVMSVSMLGLFGMLILLPLYMQQVLHLEPLETGLVMLPGGLVMGLLAPLVGRGYDRWGPRPLAIPGALLAAAALWSLTLVTEHTSVWMLVAAHMALSTGLAFLFTPMFSAGLGSVAPRLYSHASALVSTVQQVAGAAGAALFVTLMATRTAVALEAGATPDSAAASGVRVAFLAGAIIFCAAVVGVFFIRKPADVVDDARSVGDDARMSSPVDTKGEQP